ncbi:CoA-binding domain protein [Treponema primitia ZAS-2]|uniref:Redox-sensing transcriptional repressor Rex n=1 Tax=Treponema primitia (strain ATCC BAA-887 / DSM 12427 / ZAS-2) TaxID=545694 RepID=F5YPN8_TREPZ|nr:winged-helix domain-containing protein [Treponema primitia]AEF85974.1 CoA-binding domain protein [Treponema primitia ZAS-2]
MAQIPEPAKERLLYLMRLLEKRGEARITSGEIESITGWSSHTIRKDISYLGNADEGACVPDTAAGASAETALPESEASLGNSAGYNPRSLIAAIRQALGLGGRRRLCVVGLGRLGSAYLNFQGFSHHGGTPDRVLAGELPGDLAEFELAAGFDSNVNRVEILKSPAPLYPAFKMGEVIKRFSIEIALLCVPGDAAQAAAEKLAVAGIRGIVNFAPVALKLPPEIAVRNVYIVDELRALAVKIK